MSTAIKTASHLAAALIGYVVSYITIAQPWSGESFPDVGAALSLGSLYAAIVLAVLAASNLERATWRFTTLSDVIRQAGRTLLAVGIFAALVIATDEASARQAQVLVLAWCLHLGALFALLALRKLTHERSLLRTLMPLAARRHGGRAVLVAGSLDLADSFLRELARDPRSDQHAIGLLALDRSDIGKVVRGLRVSGALDAIETTVQGLADRSTPVSAIVFTAPAEVTQIVHGAAVAGYAERLHQGPATADELAASAGLNVPAVGRHLRACASLGLVTFDGRAFSATPLLDILRLDHPQSLRGFALAQPAPGHWLPWGRFVDALSTGEHQTVATLGSGLFDYYARTPAEADAFTEAMEGLTGAVASEAARVLDMTGVRRVVDIGGGSGSGALLAPLLEANPTLSGALYDYPHIIDGEAFSNIPSLISKRIGKVGGDFLQQVPPADLYLMKWILYCLNERKFGRVDHAICIHDTV